MYIKMQFGPFRCSCNRFCVQFCNVQKEGRGKDPNEHRWNLCRKDGILWSELKSSKLGYCPSSLCNLLEKWICLLVRKKGGFRNILNVFVSSKVDSSPHGKYFIWIHLVVHLPGQLHGLQRRNERQISFPGLNQAYFNTAAGLAINLLKEYGFFARGCVTVFHFLPSNSRSKVGGLDKPS